MVYTFQDALNNRDDLKIGARRGNFISIESPSIQTPRLFIPFGFSEFDTGSARKVSLDLTVGTEPVIQDYVKYVESRVRESLPTISDEEFVEYFKPSINGNNMKFKVDGKTVVVHDGYKVESPSPRDFRQHTAMAIVRPSLVYFFNSRIGITWYAEEIMIFDKTVVRQDAGPVTPPRPMFI